MPLPAKAVMRDRQSYLQILKSSALIGSASALNIVIGILRVKVMAVFLGPAGFGLMGTYGSITDLARSVAEMGINRSGVRQIAAATGSDDPRRIARTVTVLRRAAVVLGVIGALVMVLLSGVISQVSFGSAQHAGDVAVLSIAVFFGLVAGAQGALLQGLRRIPDIARVGVWGGLLGTLTCIPIVYFFGERGVAPSLVCLAAMGVVTSTWYSRKVGIEAPAMTAREVGAEAAELLKLGVAFMTSALLMMGAAYVVRIIVLRNAGLEAAGLYQAAWTLGGLYVGFILQAMGTDFYPRLVAAIGDHPVCNRVVNEQAHVSLLLAGPGVIATLAFTPLVLDLFYSVKFALAGAPLRWICLGMALRVITWPMGYIIVAKNRQALFFASELAWTVVNLGLSWICLRSFGLTGAGIAFFGSYAFHGLMVYPLANRLTGFRWSAANRRAGLLFMGMIGFVFGSSYVLPPAWATTFGAAVMLASGIYSIRELTTLVSPADLPRPVRRLLAALAAFPPMGRLLGMPQANPNTHRAEGGDESTGIHAAAAARLKRAFSTHGQILDAAQRCLATGDHKGAAALAQVAARYAFPANVGLYSSPRLESLLLDLGRRVETEAGQDTVTVDRKGKQRFVLHVLSYAKPIGGDSRFAWRWMQQDQGSRHAIVITSQDDVAGTYDIPPEMKEAALASGGYVLSLRSPTSRPLEQARELRALCRQVDVVALHLYPYDIVPALALANDCEAKTMYVNHSDHTFWVGSGVVHCIAHLRTQSPGFLLHSRHLKAQTAPLLPIPLDRTLSSSSREEAKRALGLEASQLVLLTIASPFKFQAPGQLGLLDLVLPVVAQSPRAKLIAVGPDRSGAWAAAHAETGGRIQPLGRRWGNEQLYAAADIYLDSVPFSSITSLLEAGLNGTPLVGFLPDSQPDLLGPGAPGLEGVMFVARDADTYRTHLLRLLDDDNLRRSVGDATRQHILDTHGEASWLENLDQMYATLEKSSARGCLLEGSEDRFEPGALSLALAQLFKQVQGPLQVRQMIAHHVGALPYRSRVALTWKVYRCGLDLCYLNLLPPPLDTFVRRGGRRVRSWIGGRGLRPVRR